MTKIADLGISVRKSPRGFVRKIASPGHTAPEALLHRGLEPLSEKARLTVHVKNSFFTCKN